MNKRKHRIEHTEFHHSSLIWLIASHHTRFHQVKNKTLKKKKLKCLDFRGQTQALHTSSEFAVLDDALIWNMLKDSSMKENSIEIRIRWEPSCLNIRLFFSSQHFRYDQRSLRIMLLNRGRYRSLGIISGPCISFAYSIFAHHIM